VFSLVNFGPTASSQFMNVDLGFGQAQYGVLASFGFTALFAFSSLIAGKVSDRNDRAKLTSAACFTWGLVTVAMGFAPSFEVVFALRVLQGCSMGCTTPAAYGLLSDVFPAHLRNTANSLFASCIYLGGGLASFSALLVASLGWRGTSMVAGSVSLVASIVSLAVLKDPKAVSSKARGDKPKDSISSESLGASVRAILSSKHVRLLFIASAFRLCAGFSIGVWAAPFFREQFPADQAAYAWLNAGVVAFGGFVSSLAGGKVSDALIARGGGDPGVRARVVAVSCALAVPAWLAVVHARSFSLAMGSLFAEYLVAEMWFGPSVSILQVGTLKHVLRRYRVNGVHSLFRMALFADTLLSPPRQECVSPHRRGTAQGLFSILTLVR
jgi:sugar phosphate permease